MTPKRQETADKIIKAIQESEGLLTRAAQKAGVTYKTIWEYCQLSEEVRQARDDSKERMLDFTEGKLFEKIREGEMVAILFFLKTQGKKRGYIERSEITGAGGSPLVSVNVNSNDIKRGLTESINRVN